MKKIILSFGFLLLLSSCNNGRYQMAADNDITFILDTKTGDYYWHLGGDEWVKQTGPINGELLEL